MNFTNDIIFQEREILFMKNMLFIVKYHPPKIEFFNDYKINHL